MKEGSDPPENIEKEYNKAIEQVLYYEDGTLVSEELDFAKLEWKENKSDGSMYFFFKSILAYSRSILWSISIEFNFSIR